jgi:hypothetical protein
MLWPASLVVTLMPYRDANGWVGRRIVSSGDGYGYGYFWRFLEYIVTVRSLRARKSPNRDDRVKYRFNSSQQSLLDFPIPHRYRPQELELGLISDEIDSLASCFE